MLLTAEIALQVCEHARLTGLTSWKIHVKLKIPFEIFLKICLRIDL